VGFSFTFVAMLETKLRSHTCGELTMKDIGKDVTLCGWVHRIRNLGEIVFVDLRDRYGITQLVFDLKTFDALDLIQDENPKLGREFVGQIKGKVRERSSKNPKLKTGDIEVVVDTYTHLNSSATPPFTIEDETDGGEEIRMKYRYLDIRRNPVREALLLRAQLATETRNYLNSQGFAEIETPVLIKSTPEGARDFVVPSRMNQGEFYALPQSPQTFKQILMVGGMDRYYQIVRCFRDEDLRADRQPEFTQIDCEMSFIEREDVLQTFEGMIRHLFKAVKGVDIGEVPRISYADAMQFYGSDKPDTRFEMKLSELNSLTKGKGFKVFEDAEMVIAVCAKGCAEYTRKQLDELTDWVKRPQIGAGGLVYAKWNADGSIKSSVDKFYSADEIKKWFEHCGGNQNDLLLILAGEKNKTLKAAGELRLEMGERLGLRKNDIYKVLWVIDFPLLEWNEEVKRWFAMHHPFTSPHKEDIDKLETSPGSVRANAYDMVINGVEMGGGSIRIHNKELQSKMFSVLGFTKEEAQNQFGFLLNAFEYGAPPHGGIAYGFDRLSAMFYGVDSIRDVIAFPKNNSGRDVMIDSPSQISEEQMKELGIDFRKK
jgi:aspartyl-tRNA synthetase